MQISFEMMQEDLAVMVLYPSSSFPTTESSEDLELVNRLRTSKASGANGISSRSPVNEFKLIA
jgi:hypothetical protein